MIHEPNAATPIALTRATTKPINAAPCVPTELSSIPSKTAKLTTNAIIGNTKAMHTFAVTGDESL
jgi:hypothetical protein